MIRITIELVPLGDELSKTTLSSVEVWNTGKISSQGNYKYAYKGWVKDSMNKIDKIGESNFFFFDRKSSIWMLMRVLTLKILKGLNKNGKC